MARFTRKQILDRLNAKIRSGQPIVGGGAGTGLSAKCEEAGGIDLIVKKGFLLNIDLYRFKFYI